MKILQIAILVLFSFTACSIFQSEKSDEEISQNNEEVEEVYVFDDVSETGDQNKIKEVEKELNNTLTQEENVVEEKSSLKETIEETFQSESYYLQLGAFSTLKRAEKFTEENISNVPFQLSIIFNTNTSLYTVRSSPYKTREEVELLKDSLKSKGIFKDSFIVSE